DFGLTRSERLVIWRRRKGLTQVQAAAELGVRADRYRDWEAGRRGSEIPRKEVGKLEVREVCYLRRRRAGRAQREIAAAIGMTRLWVIKMEEGTALVDRLG